MGATLQPGYRTDDELDALVAAIELAAGPAERTVTNYRKHWPRWERFCAASEREPYDGDEDLVIAYVTDAFGTVTRDTLRHYLRAVAWHYTQSGLADITSGDAVAAAVDRKVRSNARRPGVRRTTESKPLPAGLVRAVLGAEPPAPSRRTVLLRARLVLSWHLNGAVLDRLDDVALGDVDRLDGGLGVGKRFLPATGGWDCPTAAWDALVAAGFPGGADGGLFGGVDARDGTWRTGGPADIDKLHLASVRYAHGRLTGLTAPQLRLAVVRQAPSRQLLDADHLARLAVMIDEGLWQHWRDDAILSLQIWAGLESVHLCRLCWSHVDFAPDHATLSLPWRRHSLATDGHRIAVAALPEEPNLCPVTKLRRWRWLTQDLLGPADPVIPKLKARAISTEAYDPDTRTDTTASIGAPLKRRLQDLGEDPSRFASSSGAKTLLSLARDGGANVFHVGAHLGRRDAPYDAFRTPSAESEDPARLEWQGCSGEL